MITRRPLTKQLAWVTLLLFTASLFWQAKLPVLAQTTTPTPVAESPLAPTADTAIDTPGVADLQAQIDALQAQIDALGVSNTTADPALANQVTTAIYLLDTAGLHDLDVRLNEEGVIDAGEAGHVARVGRLLSSVAWPELLATEALSLTTVLDELATALTNDDVATAAPLATQTHEIQHALSHSASDWLDTVDAPSTTSTPGQAYRVTTAVYLLDTAGLHDLDVRLNEEGVIDAGDAGNVTRVARLLSTVDWPEPLATSAISLTTTLTELATALTNDDVATAAPLSTAVHELQHDFSHEAEHWLGETLGTADGEATEDDHDADASETTEDAPAEEGDESSNESGG